MSLKRVPPPGFVDGFCTRCKAERLVPESTMACAVCGQKLDPLSLPTVPEPERPAAIPRERANAAPAPEPAAPAEPIALPDWIKEVRSWHAATTKLAAQLIDEEAQLVADLKRVRGLRKLLDAVLQRIELAPGGTS